MPSARWPVPTRAYRFGAKARLQSCFSSGRDRDCSASRAERQPAATTRRRLIRPPPRLYCRHCVRTASLVPIDRRFRFIFFALLGTFATFGVTVTLVGATLPKVLESFQWSYAATGLVLCSGSVGYFVSSFCCGMLAERFGPKLVLALGLFVQGLGLSVFLRVPSVPVNLALFAAIGIGHGAVEVVVNYCVVRMERG
ncbi:MAG: MFS transporter, partial [Armatimonadia bacterium]|nr:MFS transporter [Armatimonadia bacterium]